MVKRLPRNLLSSMRTPATILATLLLVACSQGLTVSVNDRPVYDPDDRLPSGEAIDADLQGCINYVMAQQGIEDILELVALSCANSEITSLENISQLQGLRYLDLAGNSITNITPLEDLPLLGGLNLNNNTISDISPLFNIPTLATVSLSGNNNIPCRQLATLRQQLGDNLTPPGNCRN